MRFAELIPGTLIRRDNRFRATVLADGGLRAAHVANPGRMAELFVPG
jgi:DNA-binding sugar fermentation-stimulating protein